VAQEGLGNRNRVRSAWEGGEPGAFPGGYKLLSRPYVVRCWFGAEVRLVVGFSCLDGFEVPQSGLFGSGEEVVGLESFCLALGLGEFFAEGSEEGDQPGF